MSRISIIGLGYLGATTAVAFAKLGHQVIGIDSNATKLQALQQGEVPFFEPGLEEALKQVIADGSLAFATNFAEVASQADIHFLCVGTPQAKVGNGADTTCLFSAVESMLPYLTEHSVIVGKSTVPVGTANAIREYINTRTGLAIKVAWNPEFLREGTALADSLFPDRIVIGTQDAFAREALIELYEPLTTQGIPLVETDVATAELVKMAANSFLATKISFINAMAEISEEVGADAVKLAEAIGLDERIGKKFLKTGIGFGGGCLPKDIRAFRARAEELGVGKSVEFLREVEEINLRRRAKVVQFAEEELGNLTGKRVTILGAAFKPETDDIRDSPALAVAELFWQEGASVVVHDPKALANVRGSYPHLETAETVEAACLGSEIVILATEWKEYIECSPTHIGELVANKTIIDGRNVLDVVNWESQDWRVISLGRRRSRKPALV